MGMHPNISWPPHLQPQPCQTENMKLEPLAEALVAMLADGLRGPITLEPSSRKERLKLTSLFPLEAQ